MNSEHWTLKHPNITNSKIFAFNRKIYISAIFSSIHRVFGQYAHCTCTNARAGYKSALQTTPVRLTEDSHLFSRFVFRWTTMCIGAFGMASYGHFNLVQNIFHRKTYAVPSVMHFGIFTGARHMESWRFCERHFYLFLYDCENEWTTCVLRPVWMLVMAINLSIGYICTYIPIDLSINRLVRTTKTLFSYIEFFLSLLLCVYITLICLATIGIHTSIYKYVCMHTVNVGNQERIPSIIEVPCNVYRVSLCVHSVCAFFSLLVPLIYQCFGAIYEMLALCLSTNLHFYGAQHITPHHLSIWRAKTSTWAVG